MNKETVIAVIMVGLVILAGVQAIEISSMKGDITSLAAESPSTGTAGTQGATRYSPSASPSAGMVGGC